jgi:hypothetical protein
MKINYMDRILVLALFVTLASCQKDNQNPAFDPNDKGSIAITFDNVVGKQDLSLDKLNYTNASGEQFNVSFLQYYISNIRLKTAAGKEYVVPQESSYFLIKEQDVASQTITISNVPAEDYTQLTFTIGIDSARNTADVGKRIGCLDVGVDGQGKDMYWSWNSGYIFFKMEGISPQAPADPSGQNKFRYHIGGFGGYNAKTINNIKTKTLVFGTDKAQVRKNGTPKVHLNADVLKMFNGQTNVSIAKNPTVMFVAASSDVANNYADMFSFEHIHQD